MSEREFESRLDRLRGIGGLAGSEDELYETLAEAARIAGGADSCDIFMKEANGALTMRSSTGAPEYAKRCRLGPGVGLCGRTLATGDPTFISKAAGKHPDNVAYPGVDELDYEGLAALPLDQRVSEPNPLGVMLLYWSEPWPFDRDKSDALLRLANAVAQTIATFQNGLRIGGGSGRIEALSHVTRTIAASPYLEEILQLLVNMTAQQFRYAVCTVRLLDEARGELVLRATQAPARAYQRKPAIKLGESIAGRAIAERQPVIVPDVQAEPDYIGHDLAAEQGLQSMICIPLTVQDRPIGVMTCYTNEFHEFSADEISALETLAKQAAYAIEHAKLQVRSTLLQEVHHRVKNNLQQVASLLSLQMRHGSYRSLEEAMNESLNRILAISAVHDLLSREDLDLVSVRSLVEALIHLQREALIEPGREIRFEIRGDDIHLQTSQATQIALILNELIQNAVAHGLEGLESGDVHVTLEDRRGDVEIWVSDSGGALQPGFDIGSCSHLGLKIVENLVRNLGGRFTIENRLGWTVCQVQFLRGSME